MSRQQLRKINKVYRKAHWYMLDSRCRWYHDGARRRARQDAKTMTKRARRREAGHIILEQLE